MLVQFPLAAFRVDLHPNHSIRRDKRPQPQLHARRHEIHRLRGARLGLRSSCVAELIAKMDQIGKTFKILMIKTNMALPYTTVFMDLDCGYWSPENEAKMRELMKK